MHLLNITRKISITTKYLSEWYRHVYRRKWHSKRLWLHLTSFFVEPDSFHGFLKMSLRLTVIFKIDLIRDCLKFLAWTWIINDWFIILNWRRKRSIAKRLVWVLQSSHYVSSENTIGRRKLDFCSVSLTTKVICSNAFIEMLNTKFSAFSILMTILQFHFNKNSYWLFINENLKCVMKINVYKYNRSNLIIFVLLLHFCANKITKICHIFNL